MRNEDIHAALKHTMDTPGWQLVLAVVEQAKSGALVAAANAANPHEMTMQMGRVRALLDLPAQIEAWKRNTAPKK